MSDLTKFLETNLKPYLDTETNSFSAPIQEEYLSEQGWIDKNYICKKANVHLSTASFRKTIKNVFGTAEFKMQEVENQVTQEEFFEVHEFGKCPARNWIEIFAKKGRVLTRTKLFEYMLNYTEENSIGSYRIRPNGEYRSH